MGIQETIFKKDANKIKELNVVSIIDITGSMSNQLEGVKNYVHQVIDDSFEGLKHHIITYTESYKKSYVSYKKQAETVDLKSYVNNIKLCIPPGYESKVNASGEDGPENVIHA